MRRDRGGDLPDWPRWCFLPLAGWYSIVSADSGHYHLPPDLVPDVSRLAALGTWRYTQGIYRIDPDMYDALTKTSIQGNLPSEIFIRLPEWCLYIETPGLRFGDWSLYGVFAHMEHDANDGRAELRFVLDTTTSGLQSLVIHIGDWTVAEALDRVVAEIEKNNPAAGHLLKTITGPVHDAADCLQPLLSLIVYLCSKEPEYKGGRRPGKPQPKHTKKGDRLFPAAHPRVWEVGHATGEAIRNFKSRQVNDRARPEPHIRRAHWHGYWLGPKTGKRRFEYRWLPPIPVNVDLVKENEI
jgi:hypothetical protein